MKLHIEFNNDTPPVNYSLSEKEALMLPPLEIKVVGGGKNSRQKALINYLQQLDYAFRCLNNNVDGKIKHMELSDVWFLNQIVKNELTSFGDGTKEAEEIKYNIVIYDITAGIITEKMYLTRNSSPVMKTHKQADRDIFSDTYGNVLNNKIIARNSTDDAPLNILSVISLTELYIKNYKLSWNMDAKKLQLLTKDGSQITYGQIKEEDAFTFFKLFSILMSKGKHIGVFYINCLNYKPETLKALLGLIDLTFSKTAVVFLYNCDGIDNRVINRELIELPNYVVR